MATNGDASYLTAITGRGHALNRRNFQRLAIMRQQESLRALFLLGLDAGQIHFWRFPDRGLDAIWQCDWMAARPYRSPPTGFDHAEQALNSPALPNTGASLVALIQKDYSEFRPTIVVLPYPEDAHPDHRALARFALLGAALYQTQLQCALPELLAYRMWRPSRLWSIGSGTNPVARRTSGDATPSQKWKSLLLSPEIRTQKVLALQCYASQKLAGRQPLRDAAQRNCESFILLKPYSFTTQATQ